MRDAVALHAKFVAEWEALIVLINELPCDTSHIKQQLCKTGKMLTIRDKAIADNVIEQAEEALVNIKYVNFDLEATKREKAALIARLAELE